MKTQHTPGPFKVWNRTANCDGYPCPVIGSEHHAVAAILPGDTTTEANVALLCSAPALLDALKAALDILLRTTPPIQQGTLCEEQDHDHAIRAARAAIAQAEGGAE